MTYGVMQPYATTPGPTYNYSFDNMNRLNGMTDLNNNTIVSNVSYNAANQLLGMTFNNIASTRQYNSLGQLTALEDALASSPYTPSVNRTYNYPTNGTNNGKLSSMTDLISGETVTYIYDSLKRLQEDTGRIGQTAQ